MDEFAEFMVRLKFDGVSEMVTTVRHEPEYRALALAEAIQNVCRPYALLAEAIALMADWVEFVEAGLPDATDLVHAAEQYVAEWQKHDKALTAAVKRRQQG